MMMQSAVLLAATVLMTTSSTVISELTDSETEGTHTAVVAASARLAPPEQIVYGPFIRIQKRLLFHEVSLLLLKDSRTEATDPVMV